MTSKQGPWEVLGDEPLEEVAICQSCDAEAERGGKFCAECQEEDDREAHEAAKGELEQRHYDERQAFGQFGCFP